MRRSIWTTVARLHEAKMPLADWQRLLASDFGRVRTFLTECPGEIAGTIPCPRSGQRLHVAERRGMYLAFPEEGFEGDSAQLANLKLADVILWRLDRPGLEQGLCGVLDLAPTGGGDYGGDGARLLGTLGCGESRKCVFLGFAADEAAALGFCMGVAQANRRQCCVVLPAFFPRCDEFLRRYEHDMIVLDEVAAFGDGGLVGKRRETVREVEDLVSVEVVGDYKVLKLRDGTVIDLSHRTKCRALVRHLHQRRKNTGNREFLYQEEVDRLNAGQKAILIQSGDFKFGLFRGIHQHFDLLFTTLDKSFGRYRINF